MDSKLDVFDEKQELCCVAISKNRRKERYHRASAAFFRSTTIDDPFAERGTWLSVTFQIAETEALKIQTDPCLLHYRQIEVVTIIQIGVETLLF